jgi:hypothetical protein
MNPSNIQLAQVNKQEYLHSWIEEWWVQAHEDREYISSADWANVAVTMIAMLINASSDKLDDREKLAFETSKMIHDALSEYNRLEQ